MESLIGKQLQQTGYELVNAPGRKRFSLPIGLMGFLYPIYFDAKLWLKTYTPLAKTADIGRMGISDPPEADAAS
jgi:hypothetical protein